MEINQQNLQTCTLCHPQLKEHRIIVKTAIRMLISRRKNFNRICPLSEEGPLLGLQKTLNLQTKPQEASKARCRHLKLQRVLQKAGYSLPEINSVCSTLERNFAERSYHLWLVQSQIKNMVGSLEMAHQHARCSTPEEIPQIKVQQQSGLKQGAPQRQSLNLSAFHAFVTSSGCECSVKMEPDQEQSQMHPIIPHIVPRQMENIGVFYPLVFLCHRAM